MSKIFTKYKALFADLDTPVSIYAKLAEHSKNAFLLETVIAGERLGRYSYIGFEPLDIVKIAADDNQNSYDALAQKIKTYGDNKNPDLPFFHQGYVGLFSFESMVDIEPSLKPKSSNYPKAYHILVKSMVVFDHVTQKLFLINNSFEDDEKEAEQVFAKIETIIKSETKLERLEEAKSLAQNGEFVSNTGKEEFFAMIETAKKHIQEGDIFQVVLSHKLKKQSSLCPIEAYRLLRSLNPSPYLFIFNADDFSLVGSSPEMLVKVDKSDQGHDIEIRPIAGTYKRGSSQAEDQEQIQKLLNDPKERAEHVMLIDLARNDIGRVCEPGSISVPQNMIVEKYSHVMHIVSSVIGKLKKSFQEEAGIEALKACFPAGTLSGAPKVKAVEIIEKLEKEARGPYGGCIGHYSLDGSLNTAILIRTILIEDSQLILQAGAGLVADSVLESEWQETFNKAKALMQIL